MLDLLGKLLFFCERAVPFFPLDYGPRLLDYSQHIGNSFFKHLFILHFNYDLKLSFCFIFVCLHFEQ